MPHILPVNADNAGTAGAILENVKAQMGTVPNIFATMANSPAALEGFLAFSGALQGGVLGAASAEQIALAVAGQNSCDYCASAHTLLAKGAGIDSEEAARNLRGKANDARTAAILAFVSVVVEQRGQLTQEQIEAVRQAGISDAELVEIVAHVGLNMFTNYFNHIAGTEIDFPFVNSTATEKVA